MHGQSLSKRKCHQKFARNDPRDSTVLNSECISLYDSGTYMRLNKSLILSNFSMRTQSTNSTNSDFHLKFYILNLIRFRYIYLIFAPFC